MMTSLPPPWYDGKVRIGGNIMAQPFRLVNFVSNLSSNSS